jgi:hypothetical protein
MAVVKTTYVAEGIPFDPNLPNQIPTNGYVMTFNAATGLWEARAIGDLSGGVVPGLRFTKSGGLSVNSYLYAGQVVTSKAGQLVIGSNQIAKISISSSSTVANNTVLQLQQRSAIATFSDIAGASITVLAGQYKATVTFSPTISIGPDWELCCYNKSGSTINDAILLVYLVPA